MAASAATEDQKLAAAKAAEVARVYEAYERLKTTSHCVDFGDLVSNLFGCWKTVPTFASTFKRNMTISWSMNIRM